MGVILGTAAYMSPEQARGRAVDTRSDLWAFGAVLFEMLTGRRAFGGEDVSLTMSAVLQREPDWTALPADLAPRLRTVLDRCLQKDPRQRLQAVGDVRLALEGAFDMPAGVVTGPAVPDTARGVSWTAMGIAVAVAAGAAGAPWLVPSEPRLEPTPTRYLDLILDDPPPVGERPPVMSPDGRLIAYAGASETQPWRLYVRSLADGTTRPVPASGRAAGVSFDPESRSVAYVANSGLWVWEIGGAQPEQVAPLAGVGLGTAWLADGTIVVSTSGYSRPQRLRVADGAPLPIEIRAEDDDGLVVGAPVALPGGETLLVSTRGLTTDGPRVAALSPPGTVTSTMRWPAGDVLIGAVHASGLALFPMETPPPGGLVWVDRDGRETPTGFDFGRSVGPVDLGNALPDTGVRLSPDGQRAAVLTSAPVIVELDDVTRPLQLSLQSSIMAHLRWDPGGEHIVVASAPAGPFHGYRLAATGGSEPEPFTEQPQSIPTSFFPGGESMLGYVVDDETLRDLWVFHLDGQDEPLLQTAANERAPTLAPDGQTYAYVSDASGADRIYLQRYPDDGQPQPISGDGAAAPIWSRDGRELFFVADGQLMAVEIDLSERVPRPGPELGLFPVGRYRASDINGNPMYDVAADGRFLMLRPAAGSRTWRFIENWGADLDALLTQGQ